MNKWQSIESAPKNRKRMFVVIAKDIIVHGRNYTSDPYCVWVEDGVFCRWPHKFLPTHWCELPE